MLESVFEEFRAEISSTPVEEVVVKPKRCAYVFITAESDLSEVALDDLRKIEAVEQVFLARGAYDIVAKVTGESLEFLREDVLKRIRNIGSIKSTLTLTVV